VARRRSLDPTVCRLVDEAATRYLGVSRTTSEFARGKLRRDPVYVAAPFAHVVFYARHRHDESVARDRRER
jgi:hypothetical protein